MVVRHSVYPLPSNGSKQAFKNASCDALGSLAKLSAAASVKAPPKPSIVWKVLESSSIMVGKSSSGCSSGSKAQKLRLDRSCCGAGAVTKTCAFFVIGLLRRAAQSKQRREDSRKQRPIPIH